MPRFDYLDVSAQKKPKRKAADAALKAEQAGRRRGETAERVEGVYVRRETIRAAWREYRSEGGESVSELVEDLLLKWLRDRA